MMGKKVLILGVAAVQMDAVSQLKKMGCETFTCAMAKDGPAADLSDHFNLINILDEEKLATFIVDNKIDVVYSTGSDLAMPVACRLSERLGLPHFVSSYAANVCNHKNLMRERLTLECEGNIPFQVLDSVAKIAIQYPAILKPSDAQGQRGIFLIRSQSEFESHFQDVVKYSREGKVIVEKYIEGPEVSVNGYMVNGVMRFLIVSDRDTWPEYTGLIHKHIVPSKAVCNTANSKIKRIVEDACNRIGILNGPVYFQMKVMNGHPYIIEMTPRLDGCHMWNLLARSTGVNLMKLVFEHLLYDDISELKCLNSDIKPMELVFFCQKPKTIMDQSAFLIPKDAEDSFFYYATGDNIRPVNGRFDKVGYFIHSL